MPTSFGAKIRSLIGDVALVAGGYLAPAPKPPDAKPGYRSEQFVENESPVICSLVNGKVKVHCRKERNVGRNVASWNVTSKEFAEALVGDGVIKSDLQEQNYALVANANRQLGCKEHVWFETGLAAFCPGTHEVCSRCGLRRPNEKWKERQKAAAERQIVDTERRRAYEQQMLEVAQQIAKFSSGKEEAAQIRDRLRLKEVEAELAALKAEKAKKEAADDADRKRTQMHERDPDAPERMITVED